MSKEEKELWNKAIELTTKKYKSKEELKNRVFLLETQLKSDIKKLEIKQNIINKQKEVLDKIKDKLERYNDKETNMYAPIQECLELLEEIE
jgi:hypothetical protein